MASRRVDVRDRLWRGIQTVCVLSGLDPVIDAESVRAALLRLHADTPSARALCRFDGDSGRWAPVPAEEMADWLRRLVVDARGREPRAPADVAEQLLREPCDERPFVVTVGDGWQAWQVHHVLGDGTFAVADLIPGLLRASADAGVPTGLGQVDSALARPLLRASWDTLVREPQWQTWRTALSRVSRRRGRAAREGIGRPASELGLVVAHGAPDSVALLREWAEVHHPGVSVAVLMMAAARIALEERGVVSPTTDSVVMYDLRRYLPRRSHVEGNFAGALRLEDPTCRDPRAMGDQIRGDAALGLPLVSLLAATAGETLAPAVGFAGRFRPERPSAGPVVLTHLGSASPLRRLPWDPRAAQRGVITAAAPAALAGVTATTSEWDRTLQVAISFGGSVASRDAVAAAADDLVHRPWDLLATTGVPR